jgi:hypothetical protein
MAGLCIIMGGNDENTNILLPLFARLAISTLEDLHSMRKSCCLAAAAAMKQDA